MVRSARVDTSLLSQYAGSTCELDSEQGCITRYAMAGIRRAGMGENCSGRLKLHGKC